MSEPQIELARYVKAGDTILVGQGPGEPRALVEALIEQRHTLGGRVTVFIGALYTDLFRPEYADVFDYLSIGVVGRATSIADRPCRPVRSRIAISGGPAAMIMNEMRRKKKIAIRQPATKPTPL